MKKLISVFLILGIFVISALAEDTNKYVIVNKNFIEHSLKGLTGCKILKVGTGDLYYFVSSPQTTGLSIDSDAKNPAPSKTLSKKLLEFYKNLYNQIEKEYNAVIIQDFLIYPFYQGYTDGKVINNSAGTISPYVAVSYINAKIDCK
jgi:hypothetical protein